MGDQEEKKPEFTDPNEGVVGESGQARIMEYHQDDSLLEEQRKEPLSTGEWLFMLLVMMVPCVGIVLYLVWAFSKNENINRKNFCRAYLIMQLIGLGIALFFTIIFGSVIAEMI